MAAGSVPVFSTVPRATVWTEIGRGLPPGGEAAAAALYWEAFGGKLGRVLGPGWRAERFIRRVMSPGHVFSARDLQGHVVGIVGLRTAAGCFVGGEITDLEAVYGRAGALWRARALGVLAQDLAPGTIAVDGLAVAAQMRGSGIGAALLGRLAEDARREGYARIRLEVIGRNWRARALYERLGFVEVRSLRSPLTAAIFGFRTRHVMERTL